MWDIGARDCVRRFVDDGCIRGTSIAVSANNRFLATGSDSGVVNLYDRRAVSYTHLTLPTIYSV